MALRQNETFVFSVMYKFCHIETIIEQSHFQELYIQIKTIQMIVLVIVILMNMILLCFRMNSSPVKTSVTAPRKQMATTIQRILYLPIVYRISQFHRLCREGLQDLENNPIVSVNGCRNWFLCRNMFYAENRFFNAV